MPINPIFEEKLVSRPVLPKSSPTSNRKTRSDKKHDIKFPVTSAQKEMIRLLSKKNQIRETSMTTKLLSMSLRDCKTITNFEYQDTKMYMHVKPTQLEYAQIVDLAIRNGLSERKVVTFLILNILERSGVTR